MDLTTQARVLMLVNPGAVPPNEGGDAVIFRHLILSVSKAAERYLDRHALIATRTEYFDVRPYQRVFRLHGYPVASVVSVSYDRDQVWGSDTVVDASDYASPVYDPSGLLTMKHDLWTGTIRVPRALKIVYQGGMAADTQGFVASYPDIAYAIDQQVAFLWHRRNDMGAASISSEAGTVSVPAVDDWLPTVRAILDCHRRVPFAA